jgi:hypothetical protein
VVSALLDTYRSDVMPISTMQCPVSHTVVLRVTDLEGATIRMLCTQYDELTGGCRLKARTGNDGPLAQLLQRAEEDTLAEHSMRCQLA